MATKRFYKSTRDKRVSGVLAGIAEHFGWDVSKIRILFIVVICLLLTIPEDDMFRKIALGSIFIYCFMAIVLPTDQDIWHQRLHNRRKER